LTCDLSYDYVKINAEYTTWRRASVGNWQYLYFASKRSLG